jgi:hypothetical protein
MKSSEIMHFFPLGHFQIRLIQYLFAGHVKLKFDKNENKVFSLVSILFYFYDSEGCPEYRNPHLLPCYSIYYSAIQATEV